MRNDRPGTDLERVRLVLARELETINQYERLAREAESPEVRAFLLHLAEEEKEHVTEATLTLRSLDARQEELFAAGVVPGHFEAAEAAPARAVAPAAVPAAVQKPSSLTVGSPEGTGPVPVEPQKVVYAVPAPPAAGARPFTVGSLRGRRA